MSAGDLVGRLLAGVAACLGDLAAILADPAQLDGLVSDLGGTLETEATAASVGAVLGPLPEDLAALETAATTLDLSAPPAQVLASSGAVINAIATVVNDAHALAASPPPAGPAPFNDPAFWASFFDDALALLAYDALREQVPAAYALLRGLGVAVEQTGADGVSLQRAIHWDRLAQVLSNPGSVLASVYGWNTAFDAFGLLGAAADAAATVGLPADFDDPAGLAPACWDSATLDSGNAVLPFRVSVYRTVIAIGTTDPILATIDVGIELLPIPDATGQGAAVGLAIALDVQGTLGDGLTLAPGVTLQANAGGDASVRVDLRPSGTHLVAPASATGAVTSTLTISAQPAQPWVLGDRGGTRLEIGAASLSATAVVPATGPAETRLSVQVSGSACLDLSSADGFLQAVLGTGVSTIPIQGDLTWSNLTGLRLMRGSGLNGNIPLHVNLGGVLHLTSAAGQAAQHGAGTAATLGVSGTLTLGPLTAAVDTVGMAVTVTPAAHGGPPGNLGPLDVAFGFKPPNGIGLAIDAGVVAGGGFVLCDPVRQQYAGLLQLRLLDQLSASVIAVLDAAGPGWSLLGLVFVDGFVPVQLGFGFTLNAVGGMAGLNRSAAVDALRAGLRSGGLDAVMFPANPVAQAPKLIGQLKQDFPVTQGRYVLGPMAEIGWGDPTMVRIKLGLLIELPAPVRLVLLAQMSALLPDERVKLVVLHADAVGEIDFGQGTAALDAVLHDSKIAAFTLSGQLALRAGWGSQRELVLAVGGLHPRFQPPPGFPVLPRVILAMASGDNPRLRLEAYLAVTSNTVQVGAKLELHAAAGGFALDGHLGFDALFCLSPFSFGVEMAGGLALSYQGSPVMTVALDLLLSGPAPWHAKGTASFTVLLVNVTVSFDVSWGHPPDLTAPVTAPDPAAALLAALAAPASWSGQAPAGLSTLACLTPAASGGGPVVHPLGTLIVHQRMVPLGLELQRFGGVELAQPVTLGIDAGSVTIGGQPATGLTPVQDYFAPAQYRDLTDDQKLSSPSYESYQSGLSLGLAGFATAGWQSTPIGYATLVADPDAPAPAPVAVTPQAPVAPVAALAPAASASAIQAPAATTAPATTALAASTTPPGSYCPPGATLPAQVATGSAAQAPALGQSRYQGQPRPYATAPTLYLVVETTSLAPRTDGGLPSQPVSYTQATDALTAYLTAHPQDQGQLQVASAHLAAAGEEPPRSQLVIGTPQYPPGAPQYVTSQAQLAITATDAGSGVAALSYRCYPAGTTPSAYATVNAGSARFTLGGADGPYQIDWYATDDLGNTEATHHQVLQLDNTAPASTLAIASPDYVPSPAAQYVTSATPLTLTATDAGCGVRSISYRYYLAGQPATPWTVAAGAQAPFTLQGADGPYQLDWYATDQLGNTQAQQGQQVTLDNTPPAAILSVTGPQYPASAPQFVAAQSQITITVSDAGAGVATLSYRWYAHGGPAPVYSVLAASSARLTLSGPDGGYQLDWYATDKLGNTSATGSQVLQLDNTAPASTFSAGSPDYVPSPAAQYVTSATPLTLTATDAGSGVRSISYRYYPAGQPATPWTIATSPQAPFTLQGADGPYQLDWYATDQLGHTQAQQGQQLTLDNTPPATTLAITGPQYPASAPQFVTSASVLTLTATDAVTGVSALLYRCYVHGTQPPPLTQVATAQASFSLHGPDGQYQVDWQAMNKLGTLETLHSQLIYLDNGAPMITIAQPAASAYVHSATLQLGYAAIDGAGSGVSAVTPTLDGQVKLSGHSLATGQQIVLLTQLALGSHVFAVTASDNLGNSRTTSVTFSIIVTAASIKQDVTYFQGTGDITSASVAASLLNYLNAAATSQAVGLYSAASSDYQGFINLIAAQKGKTITATSAAIMTADAQDMINNPNSSGGIGSPQG